MNVPNPPYPNIVKSMGEKVLFPVLDPDGPDDHSAPKIDWVNVDWADVVENSIEAKDFPKPDAELVEKIVGGCLKPVEFHFGPPPPIDEVTVIADPGIIIVTYTVPFRGPNDYPIPFRGPNDYPITRRPRLSQDFALRADIVAWRDMYCFRFRYQIVCDVANAMDVADPAGKIDQTFQRDYKALKAAIQECKTQETEAWEAARRTVKDLLATRHAREAKRKLLGQQLEKGLRAYLNRQGNV
jgi:hypothetical protein